MSNADELIKKTGEKLRGEDPNLKDKLSEEIDEIGDLLDEVDDLL